MGPLGHATSDPGKRRETTEILSQQRQRDAIANAPAIQADKREKASARFDRQVRFAAGHDGAATIPGAALAHPWPARPPHTRREGHTQSLTMLTGIQTMPIEGSS